MCLTVYFILFFSLIQPTNQNHHHTTQIQFSWQLWCSRDWQHPKKGFSLSLCLSTTKDSPTARIRHTKKQREIVPRGGNLRVISIECWFFPRGRNTQTYLSAELGQLNSPEKRQRNEKKLISRIISTRLRRAVKKAAAWNHLEGAQYWFSIVWAFEGVNSACTSCHQLRRPLQRWDLHDRARESMVHRPFLQPNQKSVCSLKNAFASWGWIDGPEDAAQSTQISEARHVVVERDDCVMGKLFLPPSLQYQPGRSSSALS